MIPAIDWVSLLLATLISFISGFIWFGPKTFYPVWWKALGKTDKEEPGSNQNMVIVFGSIVVALFVQALTLFIVLDWYFSKAGSSSWLTGALAGLIIGVGIVAATPLSHRLMSAHGFKVWIVEVGNDVLNFVLMGAVIGALF